MLELITEEETNNLLDSAPLCVVDPFRRLVDTEQQSQGVWERVFNTLFSKTAIAAVM